MKHSIQILQFLILISLIKKINIYISHFTLIKEYISLFRRHPIKLYKYSTYIFVPRIKSNRFEIFKSTSSVSDSFVSSHFSQPISFLCLSRKAHRLRTTIPRRTKEVDRPLCALSCRETDISYRRRCAFSLRAYMPRDKDTCFIDDERKERY